MVCLCFSFQHTCLCVNCTFFSSFVSSKYLMCERKFPCFHTRKIRSKLIFDRFHIDLKSWSILPIEFRPLLNVITLLATLISRYHNSFKSLLEGQVFYVLPFCPPTHHQKILSKHKIYQQNILKDQCLRFQIPSGWYLVA